MSTNDLNVIFLDVDGVLNNNVPYDESQPVIQESCVQVLKKIVQLTEASLVLHSGWRRYFDDNLHSNNPEAKELLSYLTKYNLKISDKTSMCATTPEIIEFRKFSKAKPKEIAEYVKQHNITHYVVIDDLSSHGYGITKHCYKVNSKYGLREGDVLPILEKF